MTREILRELDAASRRAAPAELDGDRGRITHGKIIAALGVLFSVVMATIAFLSAEQADWALDAMVMVLLLPGIFLLPALTRRHDVRWDGSGVYGTSRLFGPTLGWSRTRIAWPEISRTGKTITGYWYVQAGDGRRIYWNSYYPGYPALVSRLKQARPSLNLAAAEGLE